MRELPCEAVRGIVECAVYGLEDVIEEFQEGAVLQPGAWKREEEQFWQGLATLWLLRPSR